LTGSKLLQSLGGLFLVRHGRRGIGPNHWMALPLGRIFGRRFLSASMNSLVGLCHCKFLVALLPVGCH
jgi:hypothetical protein